MRFRFDRGARRLWKNHMITVAAFACIVIALVPLGSILLEAAARGLRALSPSFFANDTRDGGIKNAIEGTLILIGLAGAISLPVGLLTGIYMSEYGHNRLGSALRFFTDVMTQIPSIVVGIFAYSLFLELGAVGVIDPRLVFSTLSGAIALATIMVPIVARTSEEALKLVPTSTREAALALGIPKYRVTLRVVLSSASGGLVTGALLAVARAAGETAPLIMTAFGSNFGFAGLDQPTEALPYTIYKFALSPYTGQNETAWGAALILVLLMLTISVVSRVLFRRRFGGKEASA